MKLTFEEIVERLKKIDEIVLLEMFRLSSEDLVDRFRDLIEADPDRFELELAQFYDDDDDDNNSR